MFGFWRCMHLLLLIYLILVFKSALRDIINCENFFISLASEAQVLTQASFISVHFRECSEHEAVNVAFPGKRSILAIWQSWLSIDNKVGVFFIISFWNLDYSYFASGPSHPKKKGINRKQYILKSGRWPLFRETLLQMFICIEYKAKLLHTRPNFTIVTPGKVSKRSVAIEVQLNSPEWHHRQKTYLGNPL